MGSPLSFILLASPFLTVSCLVGGRVLISLETVLLSELGLCVSLGLAKNHSTLTVSGQLVSVGLCVWLFQVFSDIGGAL